MNQTVATKCPTCRKAGNWLDGKYAPFCSQRCKTIDLGGWLNEQHVIATPLQSGQVGDSFQLPSARRLDESESDDAD
jgi:endogenous inhibitor of DNA gyrase (YacG/DUF329 family)